ncbi:MAG: hemerythrin family protein [Candidatus Pelagadaptatus aseana]|uniref:hemerythrin family protein n=1 Tax=Candidatus Pelagadaptatus aseana TaxID=3120508 RepID=UPI0039B2CE8B
MVSRRKTSDLIWQEAQHQQLFDLIDQIETCAGDGRVFARLQQYAENHFALEETYMEILDYPDRVAHIEAHNKFRVELDQMVASHRDFDDTLRASLSLFLSEWLTRHIYGVDKKFEAFVLASKAK